MGRITLNASFYPSMKIEKVKGGLRFAAFVAVEEKGKPTTTVLKQFLLKLKEAEIDRVKIELDKVISSL